MPSKRLDRSGGGAVFPRGVRAASRPRSVRRAGVPAVGAGAGVPRLPPSLRPGRWPAVRGSAPGCMSARCGCGMDVRCGGFPPCTVATCFPAAAPHIHPLHPPRSLRYPVHRYCVEFAAHKGIDMKKPPSCSFRWPWSPCFSPPCPPPPQKVPTPIPSHPAKPPSRLQRPHRQGIRPIRGPRLHSPHDRSQIPQIHVRGGLIIIMGTGHEH